MILDAIAIATTAIETHFAEKINLILFRVEFKMQQI